MIDHLGIADRGATVRAVRVRDAVGQRLGFDLEIVFGRYRGRLDQHPETVEWRRQVYRGMKAACPSLTLLGIALACGVDHTMVLHALNESSREKHNQKSKARYYDAGRAA